MYTQHDGYVRERIPTPTLPCPLTLLQEIEAILKSDFALSTPPWDAVGIALDQVQALLAKDKEPGGRLAPCIPSPLPFNLF
jgi:hypothetical protein